jgi:hypothetical protein
MGEEIAKPAIPQRNMNDCVAKLHMQEIVQSSAEGRAWPFPSETGRKSKLVRMPLRMSYRQGNDALRATGDL